MTKDNTPNEQVINDLRRSLAWLDLVMATLDEGVLVVDEDMRIKFANDAIGILVGKSRVMLMGLHIWDAVRMYENGKLLRQDHFYAAIKESKGSNYVKHTHILKTDNKQIFVDVAIGHIPKINQAVFIIRDVTEKEKADKERIKLVEERVARTEIEKAAKQIKASEERFRTLIEKSTDAIQLVTEDGKILYSTESIKNVLGYSPRELQGKSIAPFMHPADIDNFNKEFQDLLKHPNKQITIQYRVKHKDGSWAWLETTGVNHLQTSNINALVGTFRNITDRKKQEQELRYQKTLLEAQREVAPEGVLVISPSGKIVSYNRKLVEMWNFSKELMEKGQDKLALKRATEDLVDPKTFISRVNEIYKGNQAAHDELYFKDGRVFDRFGSPIIGEDGTNYGYVWFFQDITERKRMERQKDDFIGIASHELKTPLTSVKGYIQILERSIEDIGNENAKKIVSKTNIYINRLNSLISDLLDVSKIQAGKLVFNITEFDIYDLIKEGVEAIQPTSNRHKIIYKDCIHQKIYADRNRLEQVLMNLLSNAIKYSPHADKIVIKTDKEENYITVGVRDFGIGINKENIRMLFQRFYRIEASANKFSGLGIGLYISAQIIERHKGKIWVESDGKNGSTFYFNLPLTSNSVRASSKHLLK